MSRILLFDDAESERNELSQELSQLADKQAEVVAFDADSAHEEGVTYEQHIERQLRANIDDAPIGLIACDKELGLYGNYPGLSANAISVVARNLGVPFCQYSRHPTATSREIDRFNTLKRWNSEEITLTGNGSKEWATEIAHLWSGFEFIRAEYTKPQIRKLKPAAALAAIMGRDDAATRISLYGSGDQSVLTEVFAFVDDNDEEKAAQRMPRVLGTWLRLSLLRFPGLLVNETAAASYLNISTGDFAKEEVQVSFSDARYNGPFSGIESWWWRDDLEVLLLEADASDGKAYLQAKAVDVEPCMDAEKPERAGFFCMITQTPVSRANSKGNINWFPSGADLSRIRNSKFEQITSLVSM